MIFYTEENIIIFSTCLHICHFYIITLEGNTELNWMKLDIKIFDNWKIIQIFKLQSRLKWQFNVDKTVGFEKWFIFIKDPQWLLQLRLNLKCTDMKNKWLNSL